MKLTCTCLAGLLAAAAADSLSLEQNLLQQLEELKAEVVAQREVIEQLKVPRHLQSETTETIDEKIAKLQKADLGLGGALDCLALPLWSSCDVHACWLRHAGDWMLPGKECLQRADEEFGQRVLWNFGLVESGLGLCIWRAK